MCYKAMFGERMPFYKCVNKSIKPWDEILTDMKAMEMPGNFDNEVYVRGNKSNICMQALHLGGGRGG